MFIPTHINNQRKKLFNLFHILINKNNTYVTDPCYIHAVLPQAFFSIRDSVAEQTLRLVSLHLILETPPGSEFPSDILKLPLISQI